MIRSAFICMVVFLNVQMVSACDICGCAAGGNYLGILPNYKQHFAGIRYKYSHYHSVHQADGTFGDDYFNTAELWGRYVPHRKVQLFGILPMQYTRRVEDQRTNTVQQLGDASILANVILFNNSDSIFSDWKQAFQLGGGIKFPTGNHTVVQDQHTLPAAMQTGTGSIDFLINALYTLRFKKSGINLDLAYRINTANAQHYRFGNRTSCSVRYFYWKNYRQISILPHVGIDIEHAQEDQKYQRAVEFTGSHSLLANFGVDAYFDRFSVGINLQQPIKQYLNQGQTSSSLRLSMQAIFLF